jgi:hypothetical protein
MVNAKPFRCVLAAKNYLIMMDLANVHIAEIAVHGVGRLLQLNIIIVIVSCGLNVKQLSKISGD